MSEPDLQTAPALGRQGEPCAGCGAPLAADQRYCLNCGQRRGGPRVEYADLLAPEPSPPPAAPEPAVPEPAPEPPRRGADHSPLAAVGAIALLGVMLLVGVLIGRGADGAGTVPAPSIVRVADPAATTEGAEQAGADSEAKKQAKQGGRGPATGAKKADGEPAGSAASKSAGTVQASADELDELDSKSGEAYQDAIKKLPDKIATPGEAPPIDKSKAPGGGGAAETIE